jgi:hypothetical protein
VAADPTVGGVSREMNFSLRVRLRVSDKPGPGMEDTVLVLTYPYYGTSVLSRLERTDCNWQVQSSPVQHSTALTNAETAETVETAETAETAAACGICHQPVNLEAAGVAAVRVSAPPSRKLRSLTHPKRDKTRPRVSQRVRIRPAPMDDTWHQIRSHLQHKDSTVQYSTVQ